MVIHLAAFFHARSVGGPWHVLAHRTCGCCRTAPAHPFKYVRVASDILLIAIGTSLAIDAMEDLVHESIRLSQKYSIAR
jgi:hypothetical protein